MIAVQQQAETISLSKNQIVYQFLATDGSSVPYGPKGASAEIVTLNTAYVLGATVTIAWTEPDGTTESVQFATAVNPNSETLIQAQPSGMLDADYFAAIAAKIQAFYKISPLFTVTSEPDGGNWKITIQAIDTDPGYTVTITSASMADTLVSETSFAATADNTPDNYELLFDIYLEQSYGGVYDPIATLSGTPDKNGYITFDISEILHKEIKDTFSVPPIPAYDNTAPLLADVIRKHYVRYRETYTGSTEDWVYLAIKDTLCGGIKKNLFADYGFFSSLDATSSLLSWYPDGKTVSLDQPEYIAWYNYNSTPRSIMLEVKMIEEDGTETVITKHDTPQFTVPSHEIGLLPVGYTQLDLASEGITIKKYLVRVIEYENPLTTPVYISQSRSYYVDENYYEDKRYIMYLNGFCLPQTLRCIGTQDKTLEVDRKTTEKILPINYQALDSQTIQYDEEYRNAFVYRSGYLSKWEVDALQELLIYNDAYEIHSIGYIALHLTENKFNLYNSRQFLHSITFRAVPRFKDKSYSNINIPLAPGSEGWSTTPGDFWWDQFAEEWTAP